MGRRSNWRQTLSQDRFTPEQVLGQQLLNQRRAEQLSQIPLQNELREAQLSRSQSTEAQGRYKLQKEIETDRQKAAFYNGLQELESSLNSRGFPIGTKEHAEAFAAYAHEFPLARSSADVDKTLAVHAKVNDDQAALTQRIQTAIGAVPEGYKPQDVTITATGAPSIRFGSGAPNQQAIDRYAKLQGMITSHLEGAAGEATMNAGKNISNKPYTQAIPFHSTVAEANMLRSQYPTLPAIQGLTDTDSGMAIPKATIVAAAPGTARTVSTVETQPVGPAPLQASVTPVP